MELWTAFVLGLMGSLHCVGMCGPIALGIPSAERNTFSILKSGLIYNSGRIFTYACLGFIFGIFGMGATISGFQPGLSVFLGITIIVAAVYPRFAKSRKAGSWTAVVSSKLSSLIKPLYSDPSVSSIFTIGVLNGLLPCGFLMTGLAAALISDSAVHSMSYMALFGLGTLPAMLTMNLAPGFISLKTRNRIRPLGFYFALFIGGLLIYRGIMMVKHTSHEMAGLF